MLPTKEVLQFLPQRPPVVMISELLEVGSNGTLSSLTVTEENIFVENGVLSESGLMENIAQTAAAGKGYKHQLENTPVPVGFIASVRGFQVFGFPEVDSVIQTRVKEIQEVMGVLIVEGQVTKGDAILATVEMRIFTPEN